MNTIVGELLNDAELAVKNGRYEEALELLEEGIQQEPQNVQLLSRAGAICVALEQFEKSLDYFQRAKDLNPEDGDALFNLGNAFFFCGNFAKAFACFVEADRRECSAEVAVQLNYQLMVMCTVRNDLTSALIYMQRVEDEDATGTVALNPEFISKKLQLHLLIEDYDMALRYAAQLTAVEPAKFANYGAQYSLQFAKEEYGEAEKTLIRAERYAVLTEADEVSLASMKAALYQAVSIKYPNLAEEYLPLAEETLLPFLNRPELAPESYRTAIVSYSEVLLKSAKYAECIELIEGVLNLKTVNYEHPGEEEARAVAPVTDTIEELSDAAIAQMAEENAHKFIGVNLDDLLEDVEVTENEDGIPVIIVHDVCNTQAEPEAESDANTETVSDNGKKLDQETREKLLFNLVTCYLELDDFFNAQKCAEILLESENAQFAYYGRYVKAVSGRRLNMPKEELERLYNETIAYFRSRIVENRADMLASVFRARLYAEQGKYAEACRIAKMLPDEERDAINSYVEQLKKQK